MVPFRRTRFGTIRSRPLSAERVASKCVAFPVRAFAPTRVVRATGYRSACCGSGHRTDSHRESVGDHGIFNVISFRPKAEA
ncbi:hypothetical protein CP556_12380 [Natrinema sp. CBA1119]|nr:hypothetical protein CP556_12380 [Natrinema sp. CBA1119]